MKAFLDWMNSSFKINLACAAVSPAHQCWPSRVWLVSAGSTLSVLEVQGLLLRWGFVAAFNPPFGEKTLHVLLAHTAVKCRKEARFGLIKKLLCLFSGD